ncbi:aspartate kinase [Hymenobacter sp. NBH84]|uniref:aspartate kinase n=1 Tax=Hymenobacter defluvii TaxID=2054411 RepID=A0ABS3TE95_9BACT|nr:MULTISPECIES: aspartate kinase [Hymenobacter]MBO3271970.1 aspartate kinase [Hymenobacter defluvii]QNE40229.1 aspartate kinase [Hymenobacter sp. NBH84]
MLTVEKIGGTSMSAFGDVLDNIILYGREGAALYNRIFVVSAYAGVTNWLLENKKTGAPGVYHRFAKHEQFREALSQVSEQLQELNKQYEPLGLDLAVANAFIAQRIQDAQGYLDNLASILASGYVSSENILQAAREILASIGESHSAFNSVNILQNRGINATLVDLSGFHDATPYTIDQRIQKAFGSIDFASTICIATGYTKGTEGIMREFDRGYSEVTFSKIAVAVRPQEAIIHKEYHLCTADPGVVGLANCAPVGFTNYDVADQLADVGMEAIHPKASKPLEINKINLRIKNTFEPEHPGTLITEDYVSPTKRVEVVTGTDRVLIVDVYDPLMVGGVGFDLHIMEAFARLGISYSFKATSANSISLVIWEKDFKSQLVEELQAKFEKVTVEKAAMVCIIGSNIDEPGLLARAAGALAGAGINIKSAGFALRKVNIQFLVAREDFNPAVVALNAALYATEG